MRFGLSEEQTALAETARAWLAGLPGPVATADGQPYPEGVWSRIVEEQGWPLVAVPEALGGWGFGVTELMVVFEALGRALTPCPMFATAAAAVPLLVAAGDADTIARVAAGATATAARRGALVDDPWMWGATIGADNLVSQGGNEEDAIALVPDGATADVVVAIDGDRVAVYDAAMLTRESAKSLDPSRPVARVTLPGGGGVAVAPEALARAAATTTVLLAAEQVGLADAALARTVEYSKVRHQYGKAIGSFQAVQHRCAEMLLAVESARSAVWYAAWAIDAGAADMALAVATAASMAGEAGTWVSGEQIQLHGGIGFTWEHEAHHGFKRARANLALLGAPHRWRARAAAALLDGEGAWT